MFIQEDLRAARRFMASWNPGGKSKSLKTSLRGLYFGGQIAFRSGFPAVSFNIKNNDTFFRHGFFILL
jgi:hypothetical protein